MGVYLTAKQKQQNHASRWHFINTQIAAELERFRRRYPRSRQLPLLRALLRAAQQEDERRMIQVGMRYVRLTRVIPPGCYALTHGPDATVYLNGQRVRGGLREEAFALGVWHPQVYR